MKKNRAGKGSIEWKGAVGRNKGCEIGEGGRTELKRGVLSGNVIMGRDDGVERMEEKGKYR